VSEAFRLHLVARSARQVETRAIGYGHQLVSLPLGLDQVAGLLADGALVRVGRTLYDVLFPEGPVRTALAQSLAAARAERRPLLVQLHLDAEAPRLARYPWELLHDGESFLVTDGRVALSRYIDAAQALEPATLEAPLRVLLVAPMPVDLPACDGQPAGAMLKALEPLAQQGRLQLDVLSPPTYVALQELLSRESYQVLHFDGVASPGAREGDDPSGYLIFEDEHAASAPVAGGALYNALFLSNVRLAVLTPLPPPSSHAPLGGDGGGRGDERGGRNGGALAGVAPALIKAGVPAVVVLQQAFAGEVHERFAAQLYGDLSALTPLSVAVAHARGQMGPAAGHAPAVYVQDAQGEGELFVGRTQAEQPRPVGLAPKPPGPIAGDYRPDTIFVDRAHAVSHTLQALSAHAAGAAPVRVCLWGLGGVGKTAVARQVVRRGAWRFPAGSFWLSLQGAPSLASLLQELAAAMGAPAPSPRLDEARRQVLLALSERCTRAGGEALLVLDNLDDSAGDADLRALLDELPPSVRVLATMRSEPPPERWSAIELRSMAAADMERILRYRLRAAGLTIAPADEPLVPEIAALLDGYPLGIDLVLSLARSCSFAHIRDQLRAQPPPALQAALRTAINEGLAEPDRHLAARLSVLRAPFDQKAIEHLAAGVPGLAPSLAAHIQRLRGPALLSFDGERYAFDAPVREYLSTLLAPEEARACHELAYRHFAARRDLEGQVAAYQHALAAGRLQDAKALLRDKLLQPLSDAGRYYQLLSLLDGAIARPEAFDEHFLLARASVQRTLGRLLEALHSLEEVLQAPDLSMPSRALALREQGRIYYEMDDELGDHQQALDTYTQALGILDELLAAGGADRARRRWLDAELAGLFQDIATVYQYALAGPEDLAYARRLYALSAEFYKRLRDPVSRASSEKQRAEIVRLGGKEDRAEAKRIYRQVMQTYKRKGLERAYGDVLLQLGKTYQDEHGYKHALKRFQEYEETQHKLGLEREEAIAWKQQGEIHQEPGYRGRSARRAIELYSRALERLRTYGDRWSRRTVISALLRRGEAYLELGQREPAAADLSEALQRSVAMGTRGDSFSPERLSADDRRRLLWAACAAVHVDSENSPSIETAEAVQATARSLGQQVPFADGAWDCRQALDLPRWARHHG
jgi:tetratricopeptide (TPR) repeat protein